MSQDQKFQQLWEFRRRDDEIDSSSDESKSGFHGEPVLKRHKLVSNLILPEDDETNDSPRSQNNGQFDPNTGSHFEFGKDDRSNIGLGKKTRTMKNKKKKGSLREGNRKKSKCGTQDPVSVDGLKLFADSILEELKVERERMFAQMKEEMKKFVGAESVLKPTRNRGSCVRKKKTGPVKKSAELGTKTKDCNGGSLEKSVISNKTNDSNNNSHKVTDEQVNHEAITPSERNNEEIPKSSVRKSNYSDQIVSSSYLTLPSVLSELQSEQHKFHSSSKNFIHLEVSANDANENFERVNSRNSEGGHHGYFSGIPDEQQFGTFAQMGSKSLSFYNQHSTQTSSMSTGFPVPLHHSTTMSQIVMENSPRGNNLLGLRMNGGPIRFGVSHALSEHVVASNFRNHMNHKNDGRVMAFGTQDLKEGQFYPK